LQHLRAVLEVLRRNQLFAKRTKFSFCEQKVDYFRHIISSN
jgi:hypothetical protein